MKIVVIGNGIAGNAACSAICARSKGNDVKLTLVSDEPYPLYSPCIFTHYISKDIKRSDVFLKSLTDYSREGINVLLGYQVQKIDPVNKKILLQGQELTYDRLILATGSRPSIPPTEGVQKRGVRVLKSLRDADYLFRAKGKNVAIIGSGPIGVELAIALRKRNWDVCLIEALDWILPNVFDEKASSMVRRILERHKIEVLTGEKVVAIKGKARVDGVLTSDTRRRETDLVVFATGMQPSSELARGAGIEIGELGGIRTNEQMETSIKDIYACGDCVEGKDPFMLNPKLSLLWPQTVREGTVAGCNSIGEYRSIHWMADVVNLNIFGTFVGAMGQPADGVVHPKAEVLEKEGKQYYHRLVISEGRMVGAQFIGDYEGIGGLLPLIGRNYEDIRQQIRNGEGANPFLWYYSAGFFFFN